MVIIAKGKIVATDSMDNLTRRLRGSELVGLEVEARHGDLSKESVEQKLSSVAGVSKVEFKEARDGRLQFTVESEQGKNVRGDLARAVVAADWNLIELHSAGLSLEEVFLQLTASDKGGAK